MSEERWPLRQIRAQFSNCVTVIKTSIITTAGVGMNVLEERDLPPSLTVNEEVGGMPGRETCSNKAASACIVLDIHIFH